MEQQRNTNCWYANNCKEDCDCDSCIVYVQLKWQMDNSGLYPAQQKPIKLYIHQYNQIDEPAYKRLSDIRQNITDFVDEHKNLYICGEIPGNGKTSWAIRMLHTYFHYRAEGNYTNLLGMFVNTTDLLLKLKDFNHPISQKYLKNLETVDLVVFDDIGVTGMTQYDLAQFFNIVNKRISAEKSTIFTSNIVDLHTLESMIGARLASRIYNASEIIELKGLDMR